MLFQKLASFEHKVKLLFIINNLAFLKKLIKLSFTTLIILVITTNTPSSTYISLTSTPCHTTCSSSTAIFLCHSKLCIPQMPNQILIFFLWKSILLKLIFNFINLRCNDSWLLNTSKTFLFSWLKIVNFVLGHILGCSIDYNSYIIRNSSI